MLVRGCIVDPSIVTCAIVSCYCSILSDLLTNVKNPLDEDRLQLTMDTIDIILNDKKTRPALGDRK